jgi:phosphohistidine phosphatase
MHRLHLLRHAKSDQTDAVEDHERPLSRRGRETARRVGESLPAALGQLDLVLCSPALRTRQTAELVLAGFRPTLRILFEEELYLASDAVLLRRLRRLDFRTEGVLVVGHNPGLHELATKLASPDSPRFREMAVGKFPTLARASLAIEAGWQSVGRGTHALTDYVTPKSLDKGD